MDDKLLRRAGLDYHEWAQVKRHSSWQAFIDTEKPLADRMFALTTKGSYSAFEAKFQPGDWLVFGCETSGLPDTVRDHFAPTQRLRLPMVEGQRSLNLSNAAAVIVYEAWRQCGFQ